MEWINVKTRVPDDRRSVLAWGYYGVLGHMFSGPEGTFLGATKFNPCCDGGKFDIEKCGGWSGHRDVTHWAEIKGPVVFGKAAPPAQEG